MKWHTADTEIELAAEGDNHKSENIYVIFIEVRHYMIKTISSVLVMQSPMQCLLNSNVKVVKLCHVHIVYFWNYVAVIFPYFCKFAIALLIQLLPIFTYVQ